MASKSVDLNIKDYVKLDTGTDTAIAMQNTDKSKRLVRIVLAASLPAANVTNYFRIAADEGFSRDGMSGNMYGLAIGGKARVTVGE